MVKIEFTKRELNEIETLIDKEIVKSYEDILYKIRDKIERVN